MHTFDLAAPTVPDGFGDYLDAVKALCKSAGAVDGMAHMTVNEKVVACGMSQRRPKPHVDGCFEPSRMSWDSGSWTHDRNGVMAGSFRRMPVIVAASVEGCQAWRGECSVGNPTMMEINHTSSSAKEKIPTANVGYLLSPDCVHESMVLNRPTRRTFLRIALP